MKANSIVVSMGCGLLLGLAPSTYGALVAYEGFDYASGSSLAGQNGGIGFSDAWGTSTGVGTIQSPSLSYDQLQTSGGRFYTAGDSTGNLQIFRTLGSARGTDGTTTWISLTGQRTGDKSSAFGVNGGPSYVRGWNVSLFQDGNERLALGESSRNSGPQPDTDTWGFAVTGSSTHANTVWSTSPIDAESFVLVRIEHGAGNVDTAYMWINPNLATEPDIATAAISTTGDFSFNRIRPFAGNPNTGSGFPAALGYFDEIRIGEGWADVTPVPEPSTMGLLALGGFGLVLCWRFKKR